MFTIVTSRTTISCASPIRPRISQRREWWGFDEVEVMSPDTIARSGGLVSGYPYTWRVASTTPSKRPLRADAERNRQRLLDAAAELFRERGLDATLDDIADRAGVGVGTAYRRFASKDD